MRIILDIFAGARKKPKMDVTCISVCKTSMNVGMAISIILTWKLDAYMTNQNVGRKILIPLNAMLWVTTFV